MDIHSPIGLGPLVASPIGALAGAVLASAGKLATNTSAPVQAFSQGLAYDGVVERAILGEAAFNVVLAMKRPRLQEIGVLDEMAKVVKQLAPTTSKLAPYIMHTLTAVALRVSLDALHNDPNAKKSLPGLFPSKSSQLSQISGSSLGPEIEEFISRLLRRCVGQNGLQVSSDVETIIQIGFREAGPVLTSVTGSGLELLSTALPDSASTGKGGDVAHVPYIEGLPERAMLGEAALQALMKVPSRNLDDNVFDIMATCISKIGTVVRKSSPGLMEDIGFLVKAIVVAPAATADEANDGPSASDIRRMKGLSFANLGTEVLEVLDYYRGNDSKPMQSILEGY